MIRNLSRSPRDTQKLECSRRPPGRSLSCISFPVPLEANQRRKFSSAGHCNMAWWLFPNRPIVDASSKMPMFLTLKLPQRTCSSWTALMKTSVRAGIQPMHRERDLSATRKISRRRFPRHAGRNCQKTWLDFRVASERYSSTTIPKRSCKAVWDRRPATARPKRLT